MRFYQPGVFDTAVHRLLPGINRSAMASKDEFVKLPAHELHQLMTERVTRRSVG